MAEMRFLMKFGGTSVADASSISRVIEIIRHCRESGNEVAVVVSAQRGVTDQLIAVATEIVRTALITILSNRLSSRSGYATWRSLEGAARDHVAEARAGHRGTPVNLQNILSAVHNLREVTPRSQDYIITFGERLNSLSSVQYSGRRHPLHRP